MLVAGALSLSPTKRRSRSLVLRGEITTPTGKRDVTILVDTGGEDFCVTAKDAQIPDFKCQLWYTLLTVIR